MLGTFHFGKVTSKIDSPDLADDVKRGLYFTGKGFVTPDAGEDFMRALDVAFIISSFVCVVTDDSPEVAR